CRQQPFACAVIADLRRDHGGATDNEAIGQPWAHGFGDVCHLVKFGDTAMVNPMPNLLGAQLGRFDVQSRFFERSADSVARKTDVVDSIAAAERNGARYSGVHMARDLHDGWPYSDFSG